MSAGAEPEFATTVAAAARAIGVHRHTLGSWIGSGLVRREPAGFHLPTLRRLAKDRLEARRAARLRRRPGTEAEKWLGELRRAQAQRAALANERQRGRLVGVAWVREQHRNRVVQIEKDLRHLGERLVAEFVRLGVPETRARRLPEELLVLIRHYARDLPPPPPPPGPDGEEHEEIDDYEADALPHDDVRDP